MLYLAAGISGIGAGAVYATCVGNAVKWFPDRRGLAVRPDRGRFWCGSGADRHPDPRGHRQPGYAAAFFWFGIMQGAIVFVLAWLMRAPLPGELPQPRRPA